MAILKDQEEQKGQGTSQVLGENPQAQQMMQEPQQAQPSGPATIGSSATQTSAPVKAMPKQQKAGTGTFANLKNYLQAAQGGGQQRVAQAATQKVAGAATGVQKGLQQAQQAFGQRMEAGSIKDLDTAKKEAADIVKAAQGVTYQAPQQTATEPTTENLMPGTLGPENTAETQAPKAPTTAQPQQYFTPKQQQRFAEIINAQYAGPTSLQQAGLYEPVAQKARVAQEAALKAQTAGGREALLRDIFSRGRDYSRGASKLDALLLNTSQQGVQQLQQQAQEAGRSQERLQALQNLTSAEAQTRAGQVTGAREAARTALTDTRAAEEKAADERLSQVVENWEQLPNYFKDILREREKGALALSEQEMGLLGIRSGEGLYNLSPDEIIKTNAAERERLITKNELSRQLALQQLANLDTSKQLQKDLLYTDLEKAGTQTAEDAINKAAIRDTLAAQEKAFQETAASQNIVGTGSKKHRQTGKRYYAQEEANLKNILEKAGYIFAPTGEVSPEDIAAGASGSVSQDEDQLGLIGEAFNPYGSGASAAEQVGTGYLDLATGGATAALRGMGLDVTGTIARNLGGTVSSKYAKNIAKRNAARDLQERVQQALEASGVANRAFVGETEQTKARQAALEKVLAAREKVRG